MTDGERTMTTPALRPIKAPSRWVEIVSPGKPSPLRAHDGVVRLGREAGNDVVIDDPFVSRVHLEVRIFPNGVEVVDLDTKNGTHYQGARIRELTVRDQVTLVLGKQITIQLRVVEDPGSDVTSPAMVSPVTESPPSRAPTAARMRGPTLSRDAAELIGRSASMQKLRDAITRLAPSPLTVLIEGETGTGKEVVARALHAWSHRANKPMVVFDCAAVSPNLVASELFGHVKGAFTGAVSNADGAFRRADGGTLFLDEIGELPIDLQPALLRALEARQVKPVGGDSYRNVDVRVIAATNRALETEVDAGRFRRDLLFRLAVGRVRVAPLRARLDDVSLLADHFARALGATVSPAAISGLANQQWPGNVRELRNLVERAVMLAGGAGALVTNLEDDGYDLDPAPAPLPSPPIATPPTATGGDSLLDLPFQDAKQATVERFERDYLLRLFEQAGYNLSEAARRSGVDRRYLRELFKKHGLDPATLRAQRDR